MGKQVNDDCNNAKPNERKFAKDLEKHFKCSFVERDTYNPIDYNCVRNGQVVAYAELKCRDHNYGRFDTLFIDEQKLETLRKNYMLDKKPNLLCIRWNDCDGYYEVNLEEKFKVVKGGRTTKYREPNDIDYVEHIPINKFKLIKDTE